MVITNIGPDRGDEDFDLLVNSFLSLGSQIAGVDGHDSGSWLQCATCELPSTVFEVESGQSPSLFQSVVKAPLTFGADAFHFLETG